jgi:hypothetical protein
MLQIHLVADTRARRHDAEIVEGALAPAQEGVALAVALVLHGHVLGEGALAAEIIDHHGMIDHEVDRRERIDLLGVAAEVLHGRAHGREVDDRGHAGEILHQHAGRAIGDLAIGAAVLQPGGHGLDVVDRDGAAILVAQQVLQ